jgi:hypothetical protein
MVSNPTTPTNVAPIEPAAIEPDRRGDQFNVSKVSGDYGTAMLRVVQVAPGQVRFAAFLTPNSGWIIIQLNWDIEWTNVTQQQRGRLNSLGGTNQWSPSSHPNKSGQRYLPL